MKLRKLTANTKFLEACKTNRLTQTFIKFKLINHLQDCDHYVRYPQTLLQKELEVKYRSKYAANERRALHLEELSRITSRLDYNHLLCVVSNGNYKKESRYLKTHKRKLFRLGLNYQFQSRKLEPSVLT